VQHGSGVHMVRLDDPSRLSRRVSTAVVDAMVALADAYT
jgi:hypothetical protein